MAIIDTRVDRFPNAHRTDRPGSLIGLLRLAARTLLTAITEADDVHRTLRRQRYAALLG
jgi:hypothetical protein